SASRTPSVKRSSAATRPVARKPGPVWKSSSQTASRVAVHTPVRLALREMQQSFARRPGGAVIDGRDIGTVIAPGAPAKLYVTARAEVRAERRFKQLQAQGEAVTYEDILADVLKRDARDGGRADSPMMQADDAVLLDTSEMTIEQATDAARRIVEAARARWELS
ncbi:MAG TPA: (d)CMP kinase, partial [Planctomycetia bacterium]|nr:(d)CMP kinase [Planctomycetia bacterium]